MQRWHSKVLGDRASAFAPSVRIQELFPPLFAAAGQPSSMAVFTRHDRGANAVIAYFSPAALELAALFKAQPCEKPPGDGIGLLVGDSHCWKILFPDQPRRTA
jgi:hypothetical protein